MDFASVTTQAGQPFQQRGARTLACRAETRLGACGCTKPGSRRVSTRQAEACATSLGDDVDFMGLTGRGVRVAIIDSGVNPAHPHVGGVAGGVEITASGESDVYLDYLGHGTAVAGAIREKAPEALLYAVKVFDRALTTSIDKLIRAIEWSIAQQVDIVNLSLGTANPAHREPLERVVARAIESGVALVAAQDSLPGSLVSVVPVALDWDCPRDSYRCVINGGRPCFFASGYPRAIPGVPPERNLNGISFAVANMTGFAARARQACAPGALASALADLQSNLTELSRCFTDT